MVSHSQHHNNWHYSAGLLNYFKKGSSYKCQNFSGFGHSHKIMQMWHALDFYVGQTSNKFSKRWNSHRSSWNVVNLSDDQEQVPLLQHVVHEHKIEKKPKISECFIVTFVEQPSYDYLDICEDTCLNKISASNTLTSGWFWGFSAKKIPKRTWLCAWISPLLFALATRRKSQKTHTV